MSKKSKKLAGPRPYTAPVDAAGVEAANDEFRAEQVKFDFRYRCEDCEHYAVPTDACSLGFPVELFGRGDHRCRLDDGRLVFCKYYETV